MPYATEDDHQYMAERGFTRRDDLNGYTKLWDGNMLTILAAWEDRKRGSLDVPPSEDVFWVATAVSAGRDGVEGLLPVVRFSDRQPTPTTAYVTAEDHLVLTDAGFLQREGEVPGRYRRMRYPGEYEYVTRYVYRNGGAVWNAYLHAPNRSWTGAGLPTAAAALAYAEVENWGRQ